ncbi:hypothetical protein Tco_0225617, partial [Tanacetum coccineum]
MENWSDHGAENKTGEVEKVYGMMARLHADNGFGNLATINGFELHTKAVCNGEPDSFLAVSHVVPADSSSSIHADNVPAGSSSSIPADYVSAGHVLVSADRDRI